MTIRAAADDLEAFTAGRSIAARLDRALHYLERFKRRAERGKSAGRSPAKH